MTHSPLLAPVLALVGWTILVLIWTIIHLQKGLRTVDPAELRPGIRGRDLETKMDPRFSFPRQNYEHLVEQPTLFYALVLALAVMGETGLVPVVLAWAYVAFRVAHTLAQARGRNRAIGFSGSSLALLLLYGYAVFVYLA